MPKQIFEDPQKPRTRVLIKRLKQLNLTIENAQFDYVSCLSSIEQFGKNNQIKHTFEDGKNRIMFFVRNPK